MQARHTLALGAALVFCACSKPSPDPPTTLDSPKDVAVVRWCESLVDGRGRVEHWTEDCASVESAYGFVANRGDRFVHAARLDGQQFDYVDYDPTIPGNTGIIVPDGPASIAMLHHPTMAVVASTREPALTVIETRTGRRASTMVDGAPSGDSMTLGGTPDRMVVVHSDDGDIVVASFPLDETLRFWRVDATCGDDDAWVQGCQSSASFTTLGELALPGAPLDIAVREDGKVWASIRDRRTLVAGALFGPAADALCGGAPCLSEDLPLATSCADGVDNDGDGLVDQDDPQCFGAGDDEAGTFLPVTVLTSEGSGAGDDAVLSACTDGVDNDGDGAVDADDDGCADSGDRSESERFDDTDSLTILNDLGEVVGVVPSQDTIASPSAGERTPACADGVDNDGDGAIDWPEDPGCYGPGDDGESDPTVPLVPGLALTEEGDLLVAVERRSAQVIFFDAETNARLSVNELDPLHDSDGALLLTEFPGPVITDTAVFIGEIDPEVAGATHARLTERRVHVAGTSGFADTIIIDQVFEAFDGDPVPDDGEAPGALLEGPLRNDLFQPIDLAGSEAQIRRVACSFPRDIAAPFPLAPDCDDTAFPVPAVIGTVTEGCDDTPVAPTGVYTDEDGNHYGLLPTVADVSVLTDSECADTAAEALVTRNVSDDFAISGGDWTVVWQGELNGGEREDAVRDPSSGETRGWLNFVGADPCVSGQEASFCSSGLIDEDSCPALDTLCDSGRSSADICELVDVCDVCPALCNSAADFCAAGVMPGDIVVVDYVDSTDVDDPAACSDFTFTRDAAVADDQPALEYVVCSVAEASLEIATFADGCGAPVSTRFDVVDRIIPSECARVALETTVRSGGWLVRRGDRVGPSPYRAVDGVCALHPDAATRWMRPTLGQEFVSDQGLSFELTPAEDLVCSPDTVGDGDDACGPGAIESFPRDFSITYALDRNMTFRSNAAEQLRLGPATSGGAVIDTDRGRRIVFLDESSSVLWVHSATTYRQLGLLP